MTNPKTKGNGAGIQFLRANVGYSGDECLRWPLSCDSHGHAQVYYNGRLYKAARMMCEMANGPPPTPNHESAHSCGMGHEGCVNPKHLGWKTRSENQKDRLTHGTAGKGQNTARSKLSLDQVAEIRALGSSMTKNGLARKFNVTPSTIAKILKGRAWAKVPNWLRAGLKQNDLEEIRNSDEPVRLLASRFGVNRGTIYRIRRGKSAYAHVPIR